MRETASARIVRLMHEHGISSMRPARTDELDTKPLTIPMHRQPITVEDPCQLMRLPRRS